MKKKLLLAVVATAVVVGVVMVMKMRAVDVEATAAVDDIEARLNDLDPVTRAAAMTKLAEDNA